MHRFGAIAVVLALAACSGESTQSSSRAAFKTSFLQSCRATIPGKAGAAYCSCTEERLEASFTDQELASVTPADLKFRAATHACAAKAGLRVRSGH